jgi:TMEM175 potassium channel family protein
MGKGRLEAFSDGVFAIIITIMVLELRPPQGTTLDDLRELWPVFLAYVLSFVNVGIYWNNHHHLFQAVRVVDGRVLWANLFLLFWLSLFPFTTAFMGENHFASLPLALYGSVLLMAGVAYYILERFLIRIQPPGTQLQEAVGIELKGITSVVAYLVAIATAFVLPTISLIIIVGVAVWWFVPDRRIERAIGR